MAKKRATVPWEDFDRKERECGRYQVVLNLVMHCRPDHVESLCEADWEQIPGPDSNRTYYHFALYGAQRADGGYLVRTFEAPDQNPYTTVYLVDDFSEGHECFSLIDKIGLERILAARGRINSTEKGD